MADQSAAIRAALAPKPAPVASDPSASIRAAFAQADQSVPQAFANAFQPPNILPALPVTPDTMRNKYLLAQQEGDEAGRKAYAEGYVRQEQKAAGPAMKVAKAFDTSGRSAAEGVPILGGMADEANAFLDSPLSAMGITDPKAYQEALDYQRAKSKVASDEHPYVTNALGLAGGLASGGAIGKVAGPVLATLPRVGASAAGLAGGAAIGGADAFTRGEGTQDRIEKGTIGSIVGGAVGMAAPLVARGVSAAIGAGSDLAARVAALRGLGLSGPSARVLARSIEADPNAAAAIAGAGPGGMLADAGPATQGLLDQTIQRGGQGANFAREQIEQRAGQGADDINAALTRALGAPQGVQTATTALRDNSAPARQAAYTAAYGTPIDYSTPAAMNLENTLQRVPQSVITRANQLMQLEGVQSQQINAIIGADGRITYERLPDVRQLDYITRALNDVAQRGDGMGALGGNTAEGRAFGNLSRDIRQSLRRLVPEYGTALDTAAEPIAARNALDFGTQLLSPGVARDEVVQTLRGMSVPERDSLRQGIRSQIDEKLANIKRSITDPNVDARQAVAAIKDFSSDAARTKLRIVLGTQEADRLLTQIDQTARAFELRAATATNSRTYGRQASAAAVQEATDPGLVGKFLAGEPIAGGKATVQAITGMGPQYQLQRQDRIYNEIARALTERRGDDAIALLQQLQRANSISGTGAQIGQTLGNLAGGGILGGGLEAGRKGQVPLLSDLLRQ